MFLVVGSARGEAYLRMADGDYRMSASELRRMDVAKLHAEEAVSYDTTIVEGTSLATSIMRSSEALIR